MRDNKACDRADPHEPHRWVKAGDEMMDDPWVYRCPGVPDDSVRPADILIGFSPETFAELDEPIEPESLQGYHFNLEHSMWVHDECGAFVCYPVTHSEWHKKQEEALTRESSSS